MKHLILLLVIMLLLYIIPAFITNSFNVMTWPETGRFFYVAAVLVMFIIVAVFSDPKMRHT